MDRFGMTHQHDADSIAQADMLKRVRPVAQFVVPGHPKAQPRMRACKRGTRAAVYDPGTADDWKSAIWLAASRHAPPRPYAGALRIDCRWLMPRPKSHFGSGRNAERLKDSAPQWHTAKPDRDNLDKPVLDVMKQVGWFVDDSQVCAGFLEKRYGDLCGVGMLTVTVYDLSAT